MATKKIRMQEGKIDIPPKNPFENDLLDRKTPAETLTRLIDTIDGPCVVAVDAAWGAGKTTFLDLWAQHLHDSGFPVLRFNAWETDFSGDPFISFSSELIDILSKEYNIKKYRTDKIKEIGEKLVLHMASGAIRHATGDIIDPGKLMKISLNPLSGKRLDAHLEAKRSIQDFKNILQKTALELSDKKEHPLVVMVDELDRCRPSYAVEFLEVTKHLFSVDHIVFVLAINRSQLAHSVRAIYGRNFDAHGYLGRFFDVDFRLPQPSRGAFIDNAFAWVERDQIVHDRFGYVRRMLHDFFGDHDLSLRQVAQAIHRLRWVFTSLRTDQKEYFMEAAVALVLRTLNLDLYYRFVRDEASDLEVADKIFERPGLKAIKETTMGGVFQSHLIAATYASLRRRNLSGESPLEQHIRQWTQDGNLDNASPVHDIIDMAKSFSSSTGFHHAVRQIELFSDDLLDARSE